ncbi:MAG: sulfatase-like hydrolase/transferase, partial [Planctomycetota bacterium]
MRSQCVGLCVASLAILGSAAIGYASDGSRPNIILIMCDDMGWSDIGCYGGEVHTPNLDRLAAEGLRFSQFYNNAKCTTTRASLVTGLYPRKGGRGQHLLDEHMVTFGEVLREAGYQTALVGKWHLGSEPPHRPYDRGFDEYYGLMDGCCNFFNPAQPDPDFKGGRVRAFGHNDQRVTEFPE